jgi:hypothetical protein
MLTVRKSRFRSSWDALRWLGLASFHSMLERSILLGSHPIPSPGVLGRRGVLAKVTNVGDRCGHTSGAIKIASKERRRALALHGSKLRSLRRRSRRIGDDETCGAMVITSNDQVGRSCKPTPLFGLTEAGQRSNPYDA